MNEWGTDAEWTEQDREFVRRLREAPGGVMPDATWVAPSGRIVTAADVAAADG